MSLFEAASFEQDPDKLLNPNRKIDRLLEENSQRLTRENNRLQSSGDCPLDDYNEKSQIRKTILCVDDEPSAMDARRLLLESEGYNVIIAASGEEGLRLFREGKIDLVLLDYWMPKINGLDLAREIRQLNKSVPIIVLSGFSQLPGEAIGIANQWILKGRSTQELLAAITAFTKTP
jgi:CheY-like chemotaxis protein